MQKLDIATLVNLRQFKVLKLSDELLQLLFTFFSFWFYLNAELLPNFAHSRTVHGPLKVWNIKSALWLGTRLRIPLVEQNSMHWSFEEKSDQKLQANSQGILLTSLLRQHQNLTKELGLN